MHDCGVQKPELCLDSGLNGFLFVMHIGQRTEGTTPRSLGTTWAQLRPEGREGAGRRREVPEQVGGASGPEPQVTELAGSVLRLLSTTTAGYHDC